MESTQDREIREDIRKENLEKKNWTSKSKKHCKISWKEKINAGTKEEKEVEKSFSPKEWCRIITNGLPLFKNNQGKIICHAEYAYKEYMSGTSFEESIEKVKSYANGVRQSYIESIQKYRFSTFVQLYNIHYKNNCSEITAEELVEYQFTEQEIKLYTKNLSDKNLLLIVEDGEKKKYFPIEQKPEDLKSETATEETE